MEKKEAEKEKEKDGVSGEVVEVDASQSPPPLARRIGLVSFRSLEQSDRVEESRPQVRAVMWNSLELGDYISLQGLLYDGHRVGLGSLSVNS